MSISKRSEKLMDEGLKLFEEGNIKEAITKFEKAVEEDPNNAVAYGNMGKLYRQQGKLGKAFRNLQKVLAITPEDMDAQFELGELLVEKEQYYDAVTYFSGLQRTADPQVADSLNARIDNIMERARIKLESGKLSDNIEELSEFGYHCIEQSMPLIALDVFKKAEKIINDHKDPKPSQEHINLVLIGIAKAYYNNNDDIKALKYLDKAIENDCSVEAYLLLTDIYIEMAVKNGNITNSENIETALKYLDKALEKNHDLPEIYDRRGDIFIIQKKFDQALEAFNKCVELEPEYASDYEIYEKIYKISQNS